MKMSTSSRAISAIVTISALSGVGLVVSANSAQAVASCVNLGLSEWLDGYMVFPIHNTCTTSQRLKVVSNDGVSTHHSRCVTLPAASYDAETVEGSLNYSAHLVSC